MKCPFYVHKMSAIRCCDGGGHWCSVSLKTITWKVEKHATASCQIFADSPVLWALKTTIVNPIRVNVMVDLLSAPDAGTV